MAFDLLSALSARRLHGLLVNEADSGGNVTLRSTMHRGSISARQSGDRGSLFGSLLLVRLGAMLLTSVLVTLVPLAYFSPPDPTWIAGLYDDADHDDAVVAITDAIRFPAIDGTSISPARLSSAPVACVGSTRLDGPLESVPATGVHHTANPSFSSLRARVHRVCFRALPPGRTHRRIASSSGRIRPLSGDPSRDRT